MDLILDILSEISVSIPDSDIIFLREMDSKELTKARNSLINILMQRGNIKKNELKKALNEDL